LFCAKQFTGKMEWQTNLEKSWIGCSDCILITKIFYREVSVHRGQDPEHGLLLRQSYAMSYSMFMPWLWLCYETSGYNMILNSFHRLSGCMPRGPPLGLKRPGFVRFRSSYDRTDYFTKIYLKTEQLGYSPDHLQNWFYFRSHFLDFAFLGFSKNVDWWGTPVNPRPDTKDPGFVRFRTRSYHTEIFMKKYSKTKKLE